MSITYYRYYKNGGTVTYLLISTLAILVVITNRLYACVHSDKMREAATKSLEVAFVIGIIL